MELATPRFLVCLQIIEVSCLYNRIRFFDVKAPAIRTLIRGPHLRSVIDLKYPYDNPSVITECRLQGCPPLLADPSTRPPVDAEL